MPTLNPRINVTLSPSLDDTVERFARLQRRSKSQVLRELLEAAEPALQRAVAMMEAASRAGPEVMQGLAGSMLRAQERAEDILAGSLGRIDQAADLVRQAEAVKGRRPVRAEPARHGTGAALGVNPPSSNRGVRSPGKTLKAGKKPARKGG